MLSVPFNGDISLLQYASSHGAAEVYGQLPDDGIGGARTPGGYPHLDEDLLRHAVSFCHRLGLKFNYTLNSLTLGNFEFSVDVQDKILFLVHRLLEIGVDIFTVGNPFLITFIRANFPNVFISTSVVMEIDTVDKIDILTSLGASRVVLSKSLNKNLKRLEKIVKYSSIELQLIVNDPCLQFCPFRTYHNLIAGFSSTSVAGSHHSINFCTMMCRKIFLEKPYKLIKASYIRPEDLRRYRDVGVDNFKLVDRKESSAWLRRVILAYHTERYPGNLADLCSLFSPIKGNGELDSNVCLRPLSADEVKNRAFMDTCRNHLRFKPIIDNSRLEKHMDRILGTECDEISCDECKICKAIYEDVCDIDADQRNIVLDNINRSLDSLISR